MKRTAYIPNKEYISDLLDVDNAWLIQIFLEYSILATPIPKIAPNKCTMIERP